MSRALLVVLCLGLLGIAACDDDASSEDVGGTPDGNLDTAGVTGDTAGEDTAGEDTAGEDTAGADTAPDQTAGQVCLPEHTAIESTTNCLQDDAVCYELDDGSWCTGTVGSPLAADCEAVGGSVVSDNGTQTCPDGEIYLGTVPDVNCLCSCCKPVE